MISEKQLAANRRNSLKSSGPKTVKGKARSSKNALKHGIFSRDILLSTESPREFNRFRRGLIEDLAPVGFLEENQADLVVSSGWFLRRIRRVKRDVLESAISLRSTEVEVELHRIRNRHKHSEDRFPKLKPCNTEDPVEALALISQTKGVMKALNTLVGAVNVPSEMAISEHAISTQLTEPDARMDRLMRLEAKYEKSYYRALREFKIMQAERKGLLVAGRRVTRVGLSRISPEDN